MQLLFIDLHCDATMPSGANEFGGGNTYSRGLFKGIADNKDIFCVYVTRKKYNNIKSQEKISDTCYIERIVLGDSINDKDTLQNHIQEALEEIRKIISKYNLNDFIIHSSYWQSGIAALVLSREYDTYYIHTIQSNGKKKKLVNFKQNNLDYRISTEQEIFYNAKYLICSSFAEQKEIHELYNINSDKLILTSLPIAREFCYPTHDRHSRILTYSITQKNTGSYLPIEFSNDYLETWWVGGPFLYYGRLHVDKGIPEIIIAWDMLYDEYGNNTPPLWIVGGTPTQIATMRQLLINEGICIDNYEKQQKLVWWGTLSPADLSCLLTKSMVLVTHSKYESGGLMVLEAMACSTPVIASPYGYAQNYIYNWYNGFTVEYGNTVLLKIRMSHFVDNPYLSDLLSKNAKKTYDHVSDSINFLKIHFDLYKGILKNDVPIYLEYKQEKNLVLEYQNIPEQFTVDQTIQDFCNGSPHSLIQKYNSANSIVILFKLNDKIYRADVWLTTLNPCKFLNNSEPYLISSTDKILALSKFQSIDAFQNLDYYSLENKISIICEEPTKQHLDFKNLANIMNTVFNSSLSGINSEPSLSHKISILHHNINYYSECISQSLEDDMLVVLNALKSYNDRREKNILGITPLIDSEENIHNSKLYGVFQCSTSEYGHNIALVLRLLKLNPSYKGVMEFSNNIRKSIAAWYVYLKMEEVMYGILYSLKNDDKDKIIDLLNYLK